MIALPPGTRVALDTNILVYTVERYSPYSGELRPIWDAAKSGQVHLIVSALALAEVLVKPLQTGDTKLEQAYRRLILDSESLYCAGVDLPVLERAAAVRAASTTLKIPDAIHLATATLNGCTHLLTNDRRLRNAPGLTVLVLDDLMKATP